MIVAEEYGVNLYTWKVKF